MPPRQKKALVYQCRKCSFILTGNDKEMFKEEGFNHQLNNHQLVSENKEWFNTHMHTYYDIS